MTTADKSSSRLARWAVTGIVTACLGAAGSGAAQEPTAPAKSTAQIDAGEPRANTSAASDPPSSAPPAAATGKAPPSAAAHAAKIPLPKTPGAADRLDLGTATVTGDREQPKVMYIVPWKSSDIGDLSGKPMNSLLDEVLAPVDREEFKREVVYYQAVRADAAQSAGKSPKQGEK